MPNDILITSSLIPQGALRVLSPAFIKLKPMCVDKTCIIFVCIYETFQTFLHVFAIFYQVPARGISVGRLWNRTLMYENFVLLLLNQEEISGIS